jgi:hypothetical protein
MYKLQYFSQYVSPSSRALRYFSFQHIQNNSGAHPALNTMCTGYSVPEEKGYGA